MPEPTKPGFKIVLNALRWVVPILFIIFIFRSQERLNSILLSFKSFNLLYGIVAFVFLFLAQGLATLRLKFLASNYSKETNLVEIFGDQLGSMALNTIAITLSGDAYKIFQLKKRYNIQSLRSTEIVFFDRLVGATSLATIALIGFSLCDIEPLNIPDWSKNKTVILLLAAFAFAMTSYLINRKIPFLRKYITFKIQCISLLASISAVLSVVFIFKGLNSGTDLAFYLFFIPLIFVLSMLPISIGGLGVRELGYGFFLSLMGEAAELGVAAGLIQYGFFLTFALAGLVVILIRNQQIEEVSKYGPLA